VALFLCLDGRLGGFGASVNLGAGQLEEGGHRSPARESFEGVLYGVGKGDFKNHVPVVEISPGSRDYEARLVLFVKKAIESARCGHRFRFCVKIKDGGPDLPGAVSPVDDLNKSLLKRPINQRRGLDFPITCFGSLAWAGGNLVSMPVTDQVKDDVGVFVKKVP